MDWSQSRARRGGPANHSAADWQPVHPSVVWAGIGPGRSPYPWGRARLLSEGCDGNTWMQGGVPGAANRGAPPRWVSDRTMRPDHGVDGVGRPLNRLNERPAPHLLCACSRRLLYVAEHSSRVFLRERNLAIAPPKQSTTEEESRRPRTVRPFRQSLSGSPAFSLDMQTSPSDAMYLHFLVANETAQLGRHSAMYP